VPSYLVPLGFILIFCLPAVLYGFSLGYLVAPDTFSSANVIATVASLPDTVKIAGKTILAAPFAFHSFNGLRHLAWDSGKCTSSWVSLSSQFVTQNAYWNLAVLSLKGAYQSGYAVLGATAVGTIALVLL
jgi:succinate dehydrogenase (ubiquinone) cytochrome b560 subunit